MLISLLHPSRSRPQKAALACTNWLDKASGKIELEYILSLDTSDPQLEGYKELFPPDIVLVSDNRSLIDAANHAAQKCKGDLLILMSDDFDCPQDWDLLLTEKLGGEKDYIVKVLDGLQDWIITLPIMDRAYYNRFEYIYHPDYFHLFADTEMTAVAHLLKKIIHLPILFSHQHHMNPIFADKKDALNIRNDKSWSQGERVYINHARENFGINKQHVLQPLPPDHVEWLKKKGVNV